MAYLDEDQRRRARARNIAQTFALVGGIGAITAISAYTLFGPPAVFWGLALVGLFALMGPRVAPDAIMRMFKARPIDPFRGGGLHRLVRALSDRAGLTVAPRLYVIPSPTLNAFAVGAPSRYSLAVTEGLLSRLDARELAGVLAHEIAHVRNNDIWVMSLADMLSRFTRGMSFAALLVFFLSLPGALVAGEPMPWAAIALLYFAPALSSLLQLALSRSREYDADLGAAALTGDPEGIALALSKLERYQGRLWEDIFMPGRRIPLPSVLRTHPETSERIARLMALRKPTPPPPLAGGPYHAAALGPLAAPRYHWTGLWF
ncbi:MAG: zinc metalloprotease HtpX [Rhodomicrobium sp.]|jgi:heat shock protein HtpX